MATGSLTQMFEEIAAGLKAGDEEIYGWLRYQLKECGGSEISVELAMGVIAKLLMPGRDPGERRGERRETGREQSVKVRYDEGVAIRIGFLRNAWITSR